METLTTLLAVVACVLLFSLAIFIHEFGHFIAAKLLGFRVDVFSIGFGPALWKKTFGGVEYRISAIPCGGYVALPQLDPEGTKGLQGTRDGEAVAPAAAWKRIVVAVAGPMGNVVLAVALAFLLAAAPGARFGAQPPVVGLVGETAEKAGFEEGDRVLSVDGAPVSDWRDVKSAASFAGEREVCMKIRRAGEVRELRLKPVKGEMGTFFDLEGSFTPCVGRVVFESARAAGLRTGDVISSVGDVPVETMAEVRAEIKRRGAGEIAFGLKRGGSNLTVRVKAAYDEKARRPLVGFAVGRVEQTAFWMGERAALAQLKWDAGQIFRVLRGLVTPRESGSVAKALGGPVMIVEVLYRQVRENLWDALGFLRFLCVNLAILNLLPIPVLDGGLILFALFEVVCRRPPPKKVVDALTVGFMWLLLSLMVFLVFRDVARSRRLHKAAAEMEQRAREEARQRAWAENFKPAFNLK